jgi:hypothetical protein
MVVCKAEGRWMTMTGQKGVSVFQCSSTDDVKCATLAHLLNAGSWKIVELTL